MKLEIVRARPSNPSARTGIRPPLLFVHGAYAGAWCWTETFLPWFAERGWDCRALSLRGHGDSEGKERLDTFRLADFADDVESVMDGMERPPVLIGHSMGGMVVQKVVERRPAAGVALLASVPPTGLFSGALVMMTRYPNLYWTLLALQTLGPSAVNPRTVEAGLFSFPLDEREMRRYASLLKSESLAAIIDMTWIDLPRAPIPPEIPVMVAGSLADRFIAPSDVRRTADHHGVAPHFFPEIGHAMMLDQGWEDVASHLEAWLAGLFTEAGAPLSDSLPE